MRPLGRLVAPLRLSRLGDETRPVNSLAELTLRHFVGGGTFGDRPQKQTHKPPLQSGEESLRLPLGHRRGRVPWCRRRCGCSAGDLGIPRLDAAGPSRGLGRGQRASGGGGVGARPEPCPVPGLEQGGHPFSGRPGGSRGPGWQLPVLVQAPWGGWPHAGVWGGWRSRGHRGQGGGSKVSAGPSRGGGRDAQGCPELDLDPSSSGWSLPSPTASARALGAQLPGSICCLRQGVPPAPLL